MPERRHTPRRKFSFYMSVFDDATGKILGHLVDVSAIGFRLETPAPIPSGKEYRLYLELTPDISNKLFLFFGARAIWSQPDDIMPNLYHVGFEIRELQAEDQEIYQRLIVKYGS